MDLLIFIVIATPFLLFAFYMLWIGLSARWRAEAAKRWPSVRGKILVSQVKQEHKQTGNGYRAYFVPELLYEYSVLGKTYQGKRLNFNIAQGTSEVWAKGIVNRFPVGQEVEVYYNPQNCAETILQHVSVNIRVSLFIFIFVVSLLSFIFLMSYAGGLKKADQWLIQKFGAPARP